MSLAIAQPRGNGAGLLTSTTQIARRVLLRFIRSPQLVVVGTMQGAMFLLIFRYVFGGAISTGGIDYVDFVVPGFITTGVLFNAMYSSVGTAEDLQSGLVARLRSLPIPRSAVLLGRALADTAIQMWGLLFTIGLGFLVGFRLHGSVESALAAFGLVVLFGFVFEWLFILVGMIAGSVQAVQGFALVIFPLTFVSSAYVPVLSMPTWLQGFAENQPMTVMVNAVRTLTEGGHAEALLGHPAAYFVARSLIWSIGLIAVFAPLAVWKYRRG
ncbi:MAG: ABC transporter permease [Candidatus Dormibacteraeota bacterium]|nr:ABC transporter permease [Candidatus Dormibacteraeota bacterium]